MKRLSKNIFKLSAIMALSIYSASLFAQENTKENPSQLELFQRKINGEKGPQSAQQVIVPSVNTTLDGVERQIPKEADDVQNFDEAKQTASKNHPKSKKNLPPLEDQYADVYLDHASNFRTISHSKPYLKNGVMYFKFGRGEPLLICSTLRVCDVQFGKGEEISSVQIGDSARWEIIVKHASDKSGGEYDHLILKPKKNNLESNLIVFTDHRNYIMVVKSSKNQKYISKVAFNYDDEPANKKVAVVYSSIPMRSKFDYRIRGDRTPWTPVRILTDGKKTYIELPVSFFHSKDTPVLHALDDDGVSKPINTRQFKNYLIADVMLDKGELVQNVGNVQKRVIFTRGGTVGFLNRIFN